ncbi:TULIP family P47-like protein [Salinarimonas sp. NSM]|uniref:TULIP family P47-like protein n=1 Tax=Salinarimonas sp. NSM TaxID=3458003 RepID=UPI00403738F5
MDLQGWDVITASNIAAVNAVLAHATSTTLPSFSFTNTSLAISMKGDFGPWAIQPGGSANRINLMVPITSGTLSAPQFRQPIDLAGVQPILNLALVLVEGSSNGTQSLTFSIETNSPRPASKDGDVYVANPDASAGHVLHGRDPTGQAEQMINDWFGQIFVENKDKISFIFATVIMNPQGEPWLAPKATAVTYFESVDKSIQALGIKSLTQAPWGPGGLPTAVDPSLLAAGDDYFFSLAPAVFLKNLLMPSVVKALNVPASTLRFNPPPNASQPTACSITNTANIPMGKVHSGAIDYYPSLTSYQVRISGKQIIATGGGQFDITGLHDAYVTFDNLTVVTEVGYDPKTQTVTFNVVSRSSPSTDEHIPWYEKEITWIIPVIGLIVNAVMDIVVATIEDAVTNSLKSTGQLSIDSIPVATAVWSGLETFKATNAELSDAFVIRATNQT